MAAQLQRLREQIHTAQNLQSVVQTMRALAEVNVRRAEGVARDAALYTRSLHVALHGALRALARENRRPMPGERAPGRPERSRDLGSRQGAGFEQGFGSAAEGGRGPGAVPQDLLAVVLASDQGLCGPFNERITAYALRYLARKAPDKTRRAVITVGVRGLDRLQAAGETVIAHCDGVGSIEAIPGVVGEVLAAAEPYLGPPRPRRLVVIGNRLHRGSGFEESHFQLFPADTRRWEAPPPGEGPFRSGPVSDGPPADLLGDLIREHLYADLFLALVESFAAEHTARLNSMRSAADNIQERLEELEAEYRRRWQDAVTQELMDVMGGVEAAMQS